MEQKIITAYQDYVLKEGKRPASVYSFAKSLKIPEAKFYDHFSSFEAIESQFLAALMDQAIEKAQSQEVYAGYTAREKFLTVLFVWAELLKANRSFVSYLCGDKKLLPVPVSGLLKPLKERFGSFAADLLQGAIQQGEVKARKLLDERYADGLWLQFIFIFNFWLQDTSKSFEKTDAAIEKSANLAFDLLGETALDSMLDLGKFLFQQR